MERKSRNEQISDQLGRGGDISKESGKSEGSKILLLGWFTQYRAGLARPGSLILKRHLTNLFLVLPPSSELRVSLLSSEIVVVPSRLSFKKIQAFQKYPKGQSSRRWRHLKQILLAENFQDSPPDLPNYVNVESPPSTQPCKRICDITGYAAPHVDPRTSLRYANAHVFKTLRSLSSDQVHQYLSIRNAAVVLK